MAINQTIQDFYQQASTRNFARDYQLRIISFIVNGIDQIEEKDLVPKKNNDDSLLKWWKPKAINRYQKLIKEERIERDFYWYEKMSEKELKDWLMNRGKSVLLND